MNGKQFDLRFLYRRYQLGHASQSKKNEKRIHKENLAQQYQFNYLKHETANKFSFSGFIILVDK